MDIKQTLVTKYGFPEENIRMLLNSEATASAIVEAIRWLAANAPSGHFAKPENVKQVSGLLPNYRLIGLVEGIRSITEG